MDAVIFLPGEGERIAAGASTAVMKATAETTGGAFGGDFSRRHEWTTAARAQVYNGQLLRSRRNLAHDGRR